MSPCSLGMQDLTRSQTMTAMMTSEISLSAALEELPAEAQCKLHRHQRFQIWTRSANKHANKKDLL